MTGNSWVEAQDFLKFDSLNNITPAVPLGTSSTFTTTTENNPVTSLSYKIQSVAYAITAGTAPTAETASYSTGGPLLLSTAATTASTRVITFGLRPASSGVAGVDERYGSLSTAIAGMIRLKCKITLTGDYPYLDIVWGNILVGSAPSSVGIRIRGRQATSFTIGGQPAVQVQVQVGGTLRAVGWFRRSLFDGSDIGIDIMALGGVASASIYPWDPAWTDFPDYTYESFSLDVPNVIGPIPIAVSSTITRTNLPYSGGVLPIYTVGAQLDNSNNWSWRWNGNYDCLFLVCRVRGRFFLNFSRLFGINFTLGKRVNIVFVGVELGVDLGEIVTVTAVAERLSSDLSFIVPRRCIRAFR